MLTRFQHSLRSLVPFASGRDNGTAALRTLRLAMVLLSVLNPAFWWVYRNVDPEAFDPTWGRLLFLVSSVVIIGLSFLDTPVRRWPNEVLTTVLYAMLGWFGLLTYLNDLSPNYALGYLFVIVAVAMVYSTICPSPRPMAGMLVVASLIGTALALGVASPQFSPAVFLVCLIPGAVIVYVTFAARLAAVRALNRSERRLAEAEMLSLTGSWTARPQEGWQTWSAGAERLLGVGPGEADDRGLAAFVHPEDQATLRDAFARLGDDTEWVDFRVRVVRPSGEIRHARAIVRLVRDAAGEPRRHEGALLDVTDQVAHESELRNARDLAEAAAAAKTAFLANMSHEIRTPLTAIIGFAQLLREDVGDSHSDLVQPIESGGRRLLDTLNSVLDLARMEAEETDLDLVPIDAACEVPEVAELLRGQAQAKGLALSVDVPAYPVAVLGDAGALSRVVTNLLSNAVKFTEAGGVSVALREVGERVEVEVADTGRGMDEAFLNRLFEPFHQASSGWGRSHEGTGLGLTISRRLVEAMGGTITVESQPGVGTRFVVSLPAAPEAVSALEPVAA